MAKAENFSLLKKLVDKIKQSKDAFAPDDKKVNEVFGGCLYHLPLALQSIVSFCSEQGFNSRPKEKYWRVFEFGKKIPGPESPRQSSGWSRPLEVLVICRLA